MAAESRLEKYIKAFVYEKTAERVEMLLRNTIIIKHVTKKGSITLAMFWANLLQHPMNFPPDKYRYEKALDRSSMADRLTVRLDAVRLSVFMGSGALVIQGRYVYEWFTNQFGALLDNFDKTFVDGYQYVPTKAHVYASGDDDMDDDVRENLTETEEYMLMLTRKNGYDPEVEAKMAEYVKHAIPGKEKLLDIPVWDEDTLQRELDGLSTGGVKPGMTYLYPLWRSLLNRWFGQEGTRVFLACPFLDVTRLSDAVNIFMHHRTKGALENWFVRYDCDVTNEMSVGQLQRRVASQLKTRDQTFAEYHMLRKLVYPTQVFYAKFMAGVKDGQAEVLLTSANFHGNHFSRDSMETVMYVKMAEEEFMEKYIKPLNAPLVATTY